MRFLFLRLSDRWRESIWFIPAACGVTALVLAFLSKWIDDLGFFSSNPGWREMVAWIPRSPEGARAVLTTIAGSMVGLAGVTFSITVVALSLAASQFGSRLLRNFTRDPRNHLVLGILLGSFLYCLCLLGLLRGEVSGLYAPPLVGLCVGLLLAIAGLGAFVFFVHHIAGQIQAHSVITVVYEEWCSAIDKFFPEEEPKMQEASFPPEGMQVQEVRCKKAGYVQAIDTNKLRTLATQTNAVAEVVLHPGTFVLEQEIWLRWHAKKEADESLLNQIKSCFHTGNRRTMEQDFEFAIHQLVEVAVRALSPGINDPFTAIACIDCLAAGYSRIAGRHLPPSRFFDGEDVLRVQLPLLDFGSLFNSGIQQIRQSGNQSSAVSIRLLEAMWQLVGHIHSEQDMEAILRQGRAVAENSMENALHEIDREAIAKRWQSLQDAADAQLTSCLQKVRDPR